MVDAVVSFVVQKLGDYLIQEAVFLREVRHEVESLKKELEWMQCFVNDAEEKQDRNPMIRKWVSDIRDIAYDTEDVLDNYLLYGSSGKSDIPIVDHEEATLKKRRGFFDSIKKCCWRFGEESNLYSKGKETVSLYSIGKEIEALNKRFSDVSRRCESYGLQNIIDKKEAEKNDQERLKQLRRATSFAVEENTVGFEDDTDILLAKLFDEEPRRLVISIYGMGGLGKTTLASKLYHNNDVKNKFNSCAWVSVSQDYNIKDLLLRIIKSFNFNILSENLEKTTVEDLERYLCKSLTGRSYLMVVDDMWHKEDWESLKRAFPDNKNGSRVIITTRIREVAERSDEKAYVHKLRFLRADESWVLFCEKAFHSTSREKGLDKLGREMVQKCGGLPLAIVVLGGLLSTKRPQEWRMVRDHIWRHLRNDSIQILHLLDLSFNDLSHQLKLCFLYLSIFPEDFEISVKKLIRLLVAEGFISQNEDRTMEEVAKDNIDELINRSLIQVEQRSWGRVSTCRVHDLLHDLAIQKGKELNFIHGINPTDSAVISTCRRQAVYYRTPSDFWLRRSNSLSRSLLLFNQEWGETILLREDLAPLSTRFPLLRVLDVEARRDEEDTKVWGMRFGLPKEIGKLFQLKYLGLHNSDITSLPHSIANLLRLQTLHLSGDALELPAEINMLQELRHLIGCFIGTLPIENLTNLQTIKYVQFESWNKVNPDKLINLRELHISDDEWFQKFYAQGTGETVFGFKSIAKLKNLRLLSVKLLDAKSFASLQPLSHCLYLVDLRLSGEMEKLPENMYELVPNLECLSLTVPCLEEDPMPALEMLWNLSILDLHFKCQYVNKLSCSAEGFPLLEILQIDADGLVEWQVEEGAMPMLKSLKIPDIPILKIPERLRSIPPPSEWEFKER